MRWLVLAALLAAPASSQGTPGTGFSLSSRPYPGGTALSATTTLSGGDLVVFDGVAVTRYAPDGSLVRELGQLGAFGFPSFVLADPDEQLVLFGESSTGGIYRLFLDSTGSPDLVVDLAFNYDAAMRTQGELFVSAATCGFNCGNEIWRVDVFGHTTRLVARLPGASGPIAFDNAGNLYYGTASALFPPPPKPSAILRWSAAQLAGPTVLDRSDAQFIGGGFVGATRLAHDAELDALYLAENNYATGENRIRRVLGSADQSPLLVEGTPFLSIANLSFQAGPDAAVFLPHQPPSGGSLVFTSTDFGSLLTRVELTPLRPTVELAGPGTTGPGAFTLELSNGPQHGLARVLYCPRASLHPSEALLPFGSVPLFLALDLPSLGSVPGLLALDADGHLLQPYTNPGGFEGLFALQLLLLDAQPRLAGTSSVAFL